MLEAFQNNLNLLNKVLLLTNMYSFGNSQSLLMIDDFQISFLISYPRKISNIKFLQKINLRLD